MHWVPIEAVTPAMILAEDLCDGLGRVLVAARQSISPARLDALRRRGVAHVAVEDPAPPSAGAGGDEADGDEGERPDETAADAGRVAQRLERLRAMFAEHRDDPAMRSLYRVARRAAERSGEP